MCLLHARMTVWIRRAYHLARYSILPIATSYVERHETRSNAFPRGRVTCIAEDANRTLCSRRYAEIYFTGLAESSLHTNYKTICVSRDGAHLMANLEIYCFSLVLLQSLYIIRRILSSGEQSINLDVFSSVPISVASTFHQPQIAPHFYVSSMSDSRKYSSPLRNTERLIFPESRFQIVKVRWSIALTLQQLHPYGSKWKILFVIRRGALV